MALVECCSWDDGVVFCCALMSLRAFVLDVVVVLLCLLVLFFVAVLPFSLCPLFGWGCSRCSLSVVLFMSLFVGDCVARCCLSLRGVCCLLCVVCYCSLAVLAHSCCLCVIIVGRWSFCLFFVCVLSSLFVVCCVSSVLVVGRRCCCLSVVPCALVV